MDYRKYNALCGSLRQLAHKLSQLDPDSDPVRKKLESEVLDKLWRMGILKQSREQGAGLSRVEREVTVSAFCRRRLAVLMVRAGMVQTIKAVRCLSPPSPFFAFFCVSGDWMLTAVIGGYIHRAGPCPRWNGGCHRPGLFGYPQYGGLCDLGGLQQDQAQYHAVSGEAG